MINPDKIEYKLLTGTDAINIAKRIIIQETNSSNTQSAVNIFFEFANRYKINLSYQPVAIHNKQPIAYALLLINPGATANIILPTKFPEQAQPFYDKIATNLLMLLKKHISNLNLAFIQAQLDLPTTSEHIYLNAGFSNLCTLSIMKAPVTTSKTLKTIAPPKANISWLDYSTHTESYFIDTILQTYVNTLDCPEVTDLRSGKDIITSHKYSGKFSPSTWKILQIDGKNAGITLINESEEDPSMCELIYMGIIPQARGKGLGKILLRKSFELAESIDKKSIRLAVDTRNIPAINLYQNFDFKEIKRQKVLILINDKKTTPKIKETKNANRR